MKQAPVQFKAGAGLGAIYLAGFMGSGKSTIGRLLARELGWSFVDLDSEIERREGVTISEIFARSGEAGFRRAEREALLEQASPAKGQVQRVVALGGGTYAFARNRETLRAAGLTFWLDADAATLWERVRGERHRPLARDRSAFEALHTARHRSYALADARIEASDEASTVLGRILGLAPVRTLLEDA